METLDSIHNLRELAERPYTLSLIAREFATIERWKKEGRRVTGLTLYRHMVRAWLLGDTGKHQFKPDHKQLLMEQLAARLWQRGERYWRIGGMEDWLAQVLLENTVLAASYSLKDRELLEEDLRTPTFLVREGEDKFRFAHTSLQEFFLAGYLRRALVEGKPEGWQLRRVSRETLDFLGQWLLEEERPEQAAALETLAKSCGMNTGIKRACWLLNIFCWPTRKGIRRLRPRDFNCPARIWMAGALTGISSAAGAERSKFPRGNSEPHALDARQPGGSLLRGCQGGAERVCGVLSRSGPSGRTQRSKPPFSGNARWTGHTWKR
jgi:hypothetical protein